MARYNRQIRSVKTAPITSTKTAVTTHQGGQGYTRDPKSELFLLAVSYLDGNAFYETQENRDKRFKELVSKVAVNDPAWGYLFLSWLRNTANIRTASLIGAAEFVKARLGKPPVYLMENGEFSNVAGFHKAGSFITGMGVSRSLINAVLQRPDEPGELIAYWHNTHGRNLPKPLKRGIADAAVRLYTEKNYIKYDSQKAAVRVADVLELTHAVGTYYNRNPLFRHIIDARHQRENLSYEKLPMLAARKCLNLLSADARREFFKNPNAAEMLTAAGMTWEQVSTWVGHPLTDREWAATLPSMGLMACVRNARNMDKAHVTEAALAPVFEKLASAEEVRKSRMLPFRFLSAYRHSNARWHKPLDMALTHSLANVPELKGNTLILVDRSGSMMWGVSQNSEMNYADTAALFGAALALRAEKADLVEFGTGSHKVPFHKSESPLALVNKFHELGGTNTAAAVQKWYRGHNRVIIITDEQTSSYGSNPLDVVPKNVPAYTWNLAGYRAGHGESGNLNRFTSGGLSDQSFRLIPLLESASTGQWPWM